MKPFVSLFVSLVFITSSSAARPQSGAPQLPFTSAADLIDQGKLDRAALLLEQEVQGPNHSEGQRARAWAMLAYIYNEQGKFDPARKAFDRALRMMDDAGDHSTDYAVTLDFYAGMLMTTGDLATAARALREAARVYGRLHDHAALARIHSHTAELMIERGKYSQAQKHLVGARTEALLASADSASISEIDATAGWLAVATGMSHDGVKAYSAALDGCRRRLGENNPTTGWSYLLLGKAQGLDHDFAEAKRSMEKGLHIIKSIQGTNNIRYVAGELAYSELLDRAGAHDEAQRIHSSANATIRNLGPQQCVQCTVSVWSLHHQ